MNKFYILNFVNRYLRNFERRTFFPFIVKRVPSTGNLIDFTRRFYSSKKKGFFESQVLQNLDAIKKGQANKLSAAQLAYTPYDCVKYRKEEEFATDCLILWWNLMREKLNDLNATQLVSILFGLEKINRRCNCVLETLSWNPIEKLAECALLKVTDAHFTAECFARFCSALKNLFNYPQLDDSVILIKNHINSMLSIAFSKFFADDNLINQKENVEFHIGNILLYSAIYGMDPPTNPFLNNIVKICIKSFELHPDREMTFEQLLINSHRIGSTFLLWKIDPGNEFWSKYFQSVQGNFYSRKTKERFYTMVLRITFEIGLTFSEQEFKKSDFLLFWQKEMSTMEQHLQENEINSVLDLCLKRYNGDVIKIRSVLSPQIFENIIRRTDRFVLRNVNARETLVDSGISGDSADRSLMPNKTAYDSICYRLERNESQTLHCRVLNYLPGCALKYNDENHFVRVLFEHWWSLFDSKLRDKTVQGYKLSHTLFDLYKLNMVTKGALVNKLTHYEENPVEKLALVILEDVRNENFNIPTFKRTLDSLIEFSRKLSFSTSLYEKISIGCNAFFEEKTFSVKLYKHREKLGELLFDLVQLDVETPSEIVLNIIVKQCAESFDYSGYKNKDIYHQYVWTLSQIMAAFIKWKVNADDYHQGFWNQLFQEVHCYLPKVNIAKTGLIILKRRALVDILFVTLMFHKEEDFELIKRYWQSEILSLVPYFPKPAAKEIFSMAEACHKFKQLETLMSKSVYDKLKKLI